MFGDTLRFRCRAAGRLANGGGEWGGLDDHEANNRI
jgi:hypothetical protein